MTLATKSGGLILKDGRLAANCECCEVIPCGCSLEQYRQLQSVVLQLSFSGFGYGGRLGTANGNLCDCDTQYGFSGVSMSAQTAFHAGWSAHFNSITANLFFDSATATDVTWRGSTPSIATPSGGTAKYYFFAAAGCGGSFFIGRDFSQGCQRNQNFVNLTAADFSQPPLAFAPGFLSLNSSGSVPLVSCGGLNVRSLYSGASNTQVFCGGTGPLDCVEANGCGSNYYRAAFNGSFGATVVINPLP